MALAQSVLLALVVAVASQGLTDPTSVAAASPGSGYAALAGQAATAVNAVAAVAGTAPAGQTTVFDPNAAALNPQPVQPNAIGAALNAAINGNSAEVAATAQAAIAEVPSAGGRFVDGFIDGYLINVVLEGGEKTCIRENVHRMTADSIGLLSTSISTIVELSKHGTPDVLGLTAAGGKAMELATTATALIKECVKADAMAIMDATKAHLMNPSYVQGRLLGNGLEIVRAMADSIEKAEADDWIAVGKDLGTVMQKTLLSDTTGETSMVLIPPMTPGQVGPNIAQGVVKGMFVDGASVKISSSTNAGINIFIDLHRCIAEEAEPVTNAINSMYLLVEQLFCQTQQISQISKIGQPKAEGATPTAAPHCVQSGAMSAGMQGLSADLTNIPVMMDRCGITPAQKNSMSAAFKDISDLKAAFTIPGPASKAAASSEALERFKKAEEYWKAGEYQDFGIMTGGLIRDLVLAMFPSQAPAVAPPAALYQWQKAHLDDEQKPTSSLALYVGGFSAVALLGMALFRVKSQQTEHHSALLQEEPEEAKDVEAIE